MENKALFEALVWFIENDETNVGDSDNEPFVVGLVNGIKAVKAYCLENGVPVPQSVQDLGRRLSV